MSDSETTSASAPSGTTWRLIALMVAVFGGLTLWLFAMEPSYANALVQENGVIETATIAGYCLALLTYFMCTRGDFLRYWYVPVILLIATMRELDMHTIPFTQSLFKTTQYFDPSVPIFEKIVSVGILVLLAVPFIALWHFHSKPFLSKLRAMNGGAWAVLCSFGCLGLAKSVDGLGRRLSYVGISVSNTIEQYALILEEVLELAFPIVAAVAIWHFFRAENRASH